MGRLLIRMLGLTVSFMILPDASAEAKAASAGQGIHAGGLPSDGTQGKSQSRPGRSPGASVREPEGSDRGRKHGKRRKSRKSGKSRLREPRTRNLPCNGEPPAETLRNNRLSRKTGLFPGKEDFPEIPASGL